MLNKAAVGMSVADVSIRDIPLPDANVAVPSDVSRDGNTTRTCHKKHKLCGAEKKRCKKQICKRPLRYLDSGSSKNDDRPSTMTQSNHDWTGLSKSQDKDGISSGSGLCQKKLAPQKRGERKFTSTGDVIKTLRSQYYQPSTQEKNSKMSGLKPANFVVGLIIYKEAATKYFRVVLIDSSNLLSKLTVVQKDIFKTHLNQTIEKTMLMTRERAIVVSTFGEFCYRGQILKITCDTMAS